MEMASAVMDWREGYAEGMHGLRPRQACGPFTPRGEFLKNAGLGRIRDLNIYILINPSFGQIDAVLFCCHWFGESFD